MENFIFCAVHEVPISFPEGTFQIFPLNITTAQKMKFSIKDFFSKCDLRIWSHLLKKPLMENFIFCTVYVTFLEQLNCCLETGYMYTQRQSFADVLQNKCSWKFRSKAPVFKPLFNKVADLQAFDIPRRFK